MGAVVDVSMLRSTGGEAINSCGSRISLEETDVGIRSLLPRGDCQCCFGSSLSLMVT
jgi:hypothetical protein